MSRYKHLTQVDDAPYLSTDQEQEELALFFATNIKQEINLVIYKGGNYLKLETPEKTNTESLGFNSSFEAARFSISFFALFAFCLLKLNNILASSKKKVKK